MALQLTAVLPGEMPHLKMPKPLAQSEGAEVQR